jgi:hypothetical protein
VYCPTITWPYSLAYLVPGLRLGVPDEGRPARVPNLRRPRASPGTKYADRITTTQLRDSTLAKRSGTHLAIDAVDASDSLTRVYGKQIMTADRIIAVLA